MYKKNYWQYRMQRESAIDKCFSIGFVLFVFFKT